MGYPAPTWHLIPKCYNKVLILSTPENENTIELPAEVVNDLTNEAGRTIAFVRNQRYTTLDRLLNSNLTSELN